MANSYSGEQLLVLTRNISGDPDTGALGARDVDILQHINEGIRLYLYPRLLQIREQYFLARERTAYVNGQAKYRLPTRALYNKLNNLFHVGSDGQKEYIEMLPSESIHARTSSSGTGSRPDGARLFGNSIIMLPEDNTAFDGNIEFEFFFQPSELALEADCRQIATSGVNTATKTITLTADYPSDWVVGTKLDIHTPESGAEVKQWDLTIASLPASDQITFTEEIDTTVFGRETVAAGDFVCLQGESARPPLPLNLHGLAARVGALHLSEAEGDVPMIQQHSQVMEAYFSENIDALEQRIEEKPRKVKGQRGFLRSRRFIIGTR